MRIKGKKFDFIKEMRRLPNGLRVQLEIIEHPGAVLIIPFISAKEVIFLRQYRPAFKRYIYELPAGTLEKKEQPRICAKRELTEETGYTCVKLTKLGKIFPVPGYSTEVIYIYKADELILKSATMDEDEIIKKKILHRDEVRRLFKTGKILDAKTICALALCGWI